MHPTLPSGLLLGAPFGIALRLHWSFLLLGGWLALGVLGRTGSVSAVIGLLAIVGLVFGSVALHEYGHALVARRYGIGTREITLLPFGGIAQLERSPSDPRQELWISVAGPAVNFALAACAAGLIGLAGSGAAMSSFTGGSLLEMALQVNLWMGAFNLLPALPMDGGRMLRAALALRVPAIRATRIASSVAQVLAGAMMAYGVVQARLLLAVIGGFVWIAARAEVRRVEMEALMHERAARMAHAGPPDPYAPYANAPADPAGEWHQPDGAATSPDAQIVGSGRARPR